MATGPKAGVTPLACRSRVKRGHPTPPHTGATVTTIVCSTGSPTRAGTRAAQPAMLEPPAVPTTAACGPTGSPSVPARPAVAGSEGVIHRRGRRREPAPSPGDASGAAGDRVATDPDTPKTTPLDLPPPSTLPPSADAGAPASAASHASVQGQSSRRPQDRFDVWRSVVQFAASKVATVCGLGHPNAMAELPDYILSLVYAGNRQQLDVDADLLGLRLVDDEQVFDSLVAKLEEPEVFTKAVQLSESKAISTRTQVQSAIAANTTVVEAARTSGKLSDSEAQMLKSQVRGRASTAFGTRHESSALTLYEKTTGTEVRGANDQRYVLRLDPPTTDHHDEAMALKRKCRGLTALAVEVVGYVDGIADHLVVDEAATEEDEWTTKARVVEIKNRVGAMNRPPPFYDEVQCVAYMHMLRLDCCDLVEVFKEDTVGNSGHSGHSSVRGSAAPSASLTTQIRVHTVSLHGPPAHHARNWDERIVPTLREVAVGIQSVRLDDHLRYRILYALASGRDADIWDVLCEIIPSYSDVRPRR